MSYQMLLFGPMSYQVLLFLELLSYKKKIGSGISDTNDTPILYPFIDLLSAMSSEGCVQESEKALNLNIAVKTDFSFVILLGHRLLFPKSFLTIST